MKNKRPTTQLEVKTVLNEIQRFVGFVYQSVRMLGSGGSLRLEVKIEPHRAIRGKCAKCLKPSPGYDRVPERRRLLPSRKVSRLAGGSSAPLPVSHGHS